MKRTAFLFATACLVACQKIDFAETNEAEDNASDFVLPIGVGEGTAEKPWTVENIRNDDSLFGQEGWVIGYAVGAAYQSLPNSTFESNTRYTSNILLSSNAACTNYERCIPVELPTKAMQYSFALPYNTERHRKCVMIKGTVGTYFKINGLRKCDAGHWLEGLDITTLDPQPEEWQDTILVTWQ